MFTAFPGFYWVALVCDTDWVDGAAGIQVHFAAHATMFNDWFDIGAARSNNPAHFMNAAYPLPATFVSAGVDATPHYKKQYLKLSVP